jgi:hypothetical protein
MRNHRSRIESMRSDGLRRHAVRTAALALVAAAGAACDTKVTNPGPVQDVFLGDSAAFPALVNGAGRAIAEALNWIGYTGAAVTREVHPAGSTGSFGITPRWQAGRLLETDQDLNTHWNLGQRARWLAEDAASRIEQANARAALRAQIFLWAGYANRLLGENMCQAVIDGGAPQPNAEFFRRAENWFDKAAQVGTGSVRTAAIAGRASVRVFLNKWNEAVADAAQVPTAFSYSMPYYNTGEDAQRNRIMFAVANQPYRAHTQWNTVYQSYFRNTSDPRTPWQETTLLGDAALECCGRVPFYPQRKHPTPDAPIRLSGGREMRLIEAEAKLRANDWQGALADMNAIRASVGVPPWTAADATQAWARLKRERGIELWLEGRRLGDMRRWRDANTPGALEPLEVPGPQSHLAAQDLCFPIPPSERETNPNVR